MGIMGLESSFMLCRPVVDLLLGYVFRNAVAVLDFTDQLIAFACGDVEIVVSEFPPLLFDAALDLFPFAFNSVPIHEPTPFQRLIEKRRQATSNASKVQRH
jgi:hypothetical protein